MMIIHLVIWLNFLFFVFFNVFIKDALITPMAPVSSLSPISERLPIHPELTPNDALVVNLRHLSNCLQPIIKVIK